MIEVKAGYKQTEIGVIPDDWEVFNLDKLSDRIGDGIHSTPKYSTDGDYFFINGNNLNNGIIEITVDTKRVSKDEYHIHKREINNTTVLLSINGTIGNIAFYNNENIILGKSAAYINLNNGIDKRYLYQIIQTEFIKKYFDNKLTGSTIKNLGLGSIRNSPIPLPPSKSEQTAIANVLSDTDALIERLEKLIAKKKAIKQGTMQQLLTGKKRLPGFEQKKSYKRTEVGVIPVDWVVNQIGKYAKLINGRAYALHEWETQGIPVIRLQNLTGSGENYYYSNLKLPEKQYCDFDDLLFMWSATFGPVIWKGAKAIYHYHIWKIETDRNKLDKLFLFYVLSDLTERVEKSSTNGGTMLHVTKKSMEETLIPLPTPSEQSAIATILSDMDTEIEALEQKREKYTMIKQGMMQQLLTGRIRIHGTK